MVASRHRWRILTAGALAMMLVSCGSGTGTINGVDCSVGVDTDQIGSPGSLPFTGQTAAVVGAVQPTLVAFWKTQYTNPNFANGQQVVGGNSGQGGPVGAGTALCDFIKVTYTAVAKDNKGVPVGSAIDLRTVDPTYLAPPPAANVAGTWSSKNNESSLSVSVEAENTIPPTMHGKVKTELQVRARAQFTVTGGGVTAVGTVIVNPPDAETF
ncbi:MAG: hypothetical protein HYY93_14195 [Planctomycetes bacterium]|nr:hypothetical protein [Planctomycetota bacterium]